MNYNGLNFSERITGKAIAKYALLPGVLPRLRDAVFTFQRLLFIFVQILGITGLIDKNHPALRPENIGQYRLGSIIALAWANLKFDRNHIPQIILFSGVIISIIITFGIILSGIAYLFFSYGSVAHAQYFSTPSGTGVPYNVGDDWAFQFLERVFGGKAQTGLDFWGTGDLLPGGGNMIYTAILLGMLKAYSQALLFIALIMILYIVMMALADAARSGKPFGEKFDSLWAPIRFAIAIGLLLPVNGGGYNGGQVIAFQAAEWGSNLATNLWHRGIGSLECKQGTSKCDFITTQVKDKGYKFVRDMYLVNLCFYGYETILAQGQISELNSHLNQISSETDTNITYSIGAQKSADYCGSIVVPKILPVPGDYTQSAGKGSGFLPNTIIMGYIGAFGDFLPNGGGNQMSDAAKKMTENAFCKRNMELSQLTCEGGASCNDQVKKWIHSYWDNALGRKNNKFFEAYRGDLDAYNKWITDSLKKDARHGWASAGVFYLRMSYAMSTVSKALDSMPYVASLPKNMTLSYATPSEPNIPDSVAKARCSSIFSGLFSTCDSYNGAAALAELLRKGASWFETAPIKDPAFHAEIEPEEFTSALKLPEDQTARSTVPGSILSGVFNYLYDSIKIGGDDLNPLGRVIQWGNSLISAASISYAIAVTSSIIGLVFNLSALTDVISDLAQTVGNILIVPGFILMFFVPFLPFMYFLFAVIEWVASVLEAVIGMPLWALTFITAEGDLAGKGIDGIKKLFEIVLRPTIIVMSLLAAVLMFTASATFLDESMKLFIDAYSNNEDIGIFAAPGIGLGLVLVYVFAVYSLATSCFKLIDEIPKAFGRWLALDQGFNSKVEMKANMLAAGGLAANAMTRTAGLATKLAPGAIVATGAAVGKGAVAAGAAGAAGVAATRKASTKAWYSLFPPQKAYIPPPSEKGWRSSRGKPKKRRPVSAGGTGGKPRNKKPPSDDGSGSTS